ncbi:hypothetical protein GCM10017786_33650 [Amycolatopsis deserti]|uniref:DUF5667 domain-containing protein n=1 Tax=Amycolatopsis deserti TaxID=185696 RepID=A0ABQ3IZP5_9PSEU|nr:DUF5667 domain-containing protein [Amycolatopsis deserti]GHE98040.1 hypothetical protein GCM10017786_33650 [Amycolatopsis deserti]
MEEHRWSARELEVISGLRGLGRAVEPDEHTRARIRADISRKLEAEPSRRRRVLATFLAAAAALIVFVGGVGLLLSRESLPGDPLYGMKLASEDAELQLTFDEAARGSKHLQFASNRLDELAAMPSPDASAFLTTLSAFATEATAGTAQLTVLGVQGDTARLDQLRTWAREQAGKLGGLGVPDGARNGFTQAGALLNRIDARAVALASRLPCYRITTGEADDLGAIPAAGECTIPPDALLGVPTEAPLPPVSTVSPPPVDIATTPTAPASTTPVVPPATGPLPPSSSGQAPPVLPPPISAPTSTRLPAPSTTTPPPLISIPPLIPGLPGLGIG